MVDDVVRELQLFFLLRRRRKRRHRASASARTPEFVGRGKGANNNNDDDDGGDDDDARVALENVSHPKGTARTVPSEAENEIGRADRETSCVPLRITRPRILLRPPLR